MKITLLGTSNAWGPNPFLSPPSPWPMTGTLSDGRGVQMRKYRTSLLVESRDGRKLLVECGPDFGHQLREFGFGEIDAILISHPHNDHIGGLELLSLYRPTSRLPVPVYASPYCWECMKTRHGVGNLIERGLVLEKTVPVDPGMTGASIGSVSVRSFPVEHSAMALGSVGFVFEETLNRKTTRALYTGDFWAL